MRKERRERVEERRDREIVRGKEFGFEQNWQYIWRAGEEVLEEISQVSDVS